MKRIPLLALLLTPLLVTCRVRPPQPDGSPPAQPPAARPHQAVSEAAPERPRIRVGLTETDSQVVVSSGAGLSVMGESGVFMETTRLERLEIRAVGANPEASFVQVASMSDQLSARAAADRAKALSQGRVQVSPNPETGRFSVRLGPFSTRQQADEIKARARSGQWSGAFVVPGPQGPARTGSLELRAGSRPSLRAPVRIRLRSSGPISVLSGTYEGEMEIFVNRSGKLTVINDLPLEAYLRGVVPNELGPAQFPRIEAIKAQAVAARTYAYANLGQYDRSGFDICATPRCQVYKGVQTHHPLSDRAIVETRGRIATYAGKPIRALFTSTCGGRTERVEEVFRGEALPYLIAVDCRSEQTLTATIDGTAPTMAFAEDGDIVNEELALARILGLAPPTRPDRSWLETKATGRELTDWIRRSASIAGRRGSVGSLAGAPTRNDLAQAIITGLGLQGRLELHQEDSRGGPLSAARDRQRVRHPPAWSFLLRARALAPFSDGGLAPEGRPSRAALVRSVVRTLQAIGHGQPEEVTYQASDGETLTFVRDGQLHRLAVSTDASLFRDVRGESIPAARLPLLGGDRLAIYIKNGEISFLKGIDLGKGTTSDRFSKHASWEVVLERSELQTRLSGHDVRGLKDLQVESRSGSGRVKSLRIIAASGDLRLTGLDIRFTLGVKENLFNIEREWDDSGIRRFRFVGRGFGHGVGMCQVGAYGMALTGASYDEILTHYYRGTELRTVY